MKKVLLLSYTQTGQTQTALKELAQGLSEFAECEFKSFSVEENFPFPWGFAGFFRAFPRCVLGKAPKLVPLDLDFSKYDLIVLGGQVWFLSPSLPLQSFLNDKIASGLAGKQVMVVLTCRNLWHSAAQIVQEKLFRLKVHFLGQVVVCEISPLWASFVTTPRWMLTGKKEAFSIFPPAGIQEPDFKKLHSIGRKIGQNLESSISTPFRITNLDRLSLRIMGSIGRNFFEGWARLIDLMAPSPGIGQDLLLVMFRVNLVLLILCLLPTTKIIEVFWNQFSKKITPEVNP